MNTIKLYENTKVEFSFQDCGSCWLGILRGQTLDIESVFNGLFNLNACGGNLTYMTMDCKVATFWTNSKRMYRFFYNRVFLSVDYDTEQDKHDLDLIAKDEANRMIVEVKKCSEIFLRPQYVNANFYDVGTVKAEKDHTHN